MFLDFWDSLIASKYTFKPIRTQISVRLPTNPHRGGFCWLHF